MPLGCKQDALWLMHSFAFLNRQIYTLEQGKVFKNFVNIVNISEKKKTETEAYKICFFLKCVCWSKVHASASQHSGQPYVCSALAATQQYVC